MSFQESLFKVGYEQAKSILPLVFIQNENIERLNTEQRLKSLSLTQDVKSILKEMLVEQSIEPSENNLRDLLISHFECLVTINNSDEDLNKVYRILDQAFTNSELSSRDSNYLQVLNRISVQTTYATLNRDRLEKYHFKFKEEELPNRIINSINKNTEMIFKSDLDTDIPSDFVRYNKVDLVSGKITNMQKARQLINLVPIYQVVGYVMGMEEVLKENMLEISYFRTDFKTRNQYVSRNVETISNIYQGQEKVVEIVKSYQVELDNILEDLKLSSDMADGWFKLPDLGLNISNIQEKGIGEILRKITMSNITSIRKIDGDEYIHTVSDLSLMMEYNLNEVKDIFEGNVNSATPESVKEIVELYNNTSGVLHIKSDTNIDSFNLMDSCNMTILSYSTSGQRAILKMMLSRPDLFKVPKVNTNLKVQQIKNVEYTGNLSDMLNF